MFDIYVISLPGSPRRASIEKVLADRGLECQFENAFDARSLDGDAFAELCDPMEATMRYGRPLSRGEVGCFYSHRSLWPKIARSGRAAIILEDDAMLDDAFFESVLHTSESALSANADVVLLGRSKLARRHAKTTYVYEPLMRASRVGRLWIGVPFKQWTSGSVGYWISASGARKALDHACGRIGRLLDDWPWHRDHGGLRIAELRPYVVWEAFETMPSSISSSRDVLSKRRSFAYEMALKPLRVIRTGGRWLVVALLMATASREKMYPHHE
ncbi:glycosyltransferase family 25 protein [Paraburkholderia sp. BL17N1]|uniref:glycosyltransferase family 25 protein n=1 Tax=Paraburkholderia sp. BL17N1 TaxID=1938798 RepID=UPI000EB08237|nr:glycosyltransferase family 25 protein [Paraburkholderia sp. BL17N1]